MLSAFGVDHGEISKGKTNPVEALRAAKAAKDGKKPEQPKGAWHQTHEGVDSAFGISEGVSKGVPKGAVAVARGATKAQKRTVSQGGATRTENIKRGLHRIGDADISLKGLGGATGRGFQRVGRFVEKRPGLTGTALVGGGGAAGYKYLNEKQPKKRSG